MRGEQPAAKLQQQSHGEQFAPETDAGDMTLSYVVADSQEALTQSFHRLATTSDAAFATGLTVSDRYLLEEEIGRGGMGQVFRGKDLRLERPVAIKVTLQSAVLAGDEQRLEEANREAKLGQSGAPDDRHHLRLRHRRNEPRDPRSRDH